MILDTSVLVALLREEADADDYLAIMDAEPMLRLSAASWVELAAVITRTMSDEGYARADDLLRSMDIGIEPVSLEQARIARDAYRTFGRGTGHPADLNSATASPMHWRSRRVSRCCSRARTSGTPMSSRRDDRDGCGRDDRRDGR